MGAKFSRAKKGVEAASAFGEITSTKTETEDGENNVEAVANTADVGEKTDIPTTDQNTNGDVNKTSDDIKIVTEANANEKKDTSAELIKESENKTDVKTEETNNAPDDLLAKKSTDNEVKNASPKVTKPAETIVDDISTKESVAEPSKPQENSEPETKTTEKEATDLVNVSNVENKIEVEQSDQTEVPKDSEVVKEAESIDKKEISEVTKTDDVKADSLTVLPETKEPAEVLVDTEATKEVSTDIIAEVPKEVLKLIEKKETSAVTKSDDLPLETAIIEDHATTLKAETIAVLPGTKEPAEVAVETLVSADTEVIKEVSTDVNQQDDNIEVELEATKKQDENVPNNTDPAPHEVKVISSAKDKTETINLENAENQSTLVTIDSDKNEECKPLDTTADDQIKENISKEKSSEDIKPLEDIISKDDQVKEIKTEESEVIKSEEVQTQQKEISTAEELVKVEETPGEPNNDILDLMGNDKIEPKPEPALLTNILDEVCETKIDDSNLSSPIVAIQNGDIKNAENAESTPGKTNGDVSHIDFEPTGIETIGKEDLLFLEDCKKQNETENKNMDVAVDNLLEF